MLEIYPNDSESNWNRKCTVPNPKHQCQQLNPFNISYFWPSNQFVEFQEGEFGKQSKAAYRTSLSTQQCCDSCI